MLLKKTQFVRNIISFFLIYFFKTQIKHKGSHFSANLTWYKFMLCFYFHFRLKQLILGRAKIRRGALEKQALMWNVIYLLRLYQILISLHFQVRIGRFQTGWGSSGCHAKNRQSLSGNGGRYFWGQTFHRDAYHPNYLGNLGAFWCPKFWTWPAHTKTWTICFLRRL